MAFHGNLILSLIELLSFQLRNRLHKGSTRLSLTKWRVRSQSHVLNLMNSTTGGHHPVWHLTLILKVRTCLQLILSFFGLVKLILPNFVRLLLKTSAIQLSKLVLSFLHNHELILHSSIIFIKFSLKIGYIHTGRFHFRLFLVYRKLKTPNHSSQFLDHTTHFMHLLTNLILCINHLLLSFKYLIIRLLSHLHDLTTLLQLNFL